MSLLFRGTPSIIARGQLRSLSTSSHLVLSNACEESGVAILTMNRPPANSLSLEMNEAISSTLKQLQSNPSIKSLILTSSNATIFSSGLDISELISPTPTRLPQFWNSLQQLYIDLYGSRLATVAAIEGHAPAAGCMLALACDWRIMYGGHEEGEVDGKQMKRFFPAIGFNETQLGIAAPPWMGQLLIRTIGHRPAERSLSHGRLYPPMEAIIEGLVDEVVEPETFSSPSAKEALEKLLPNVINDRASSGVMQKAYEEAVAYAKIPEGARVASKLLCREEGLKEMEANREKDKEHFCGFITQEVVQKNLKRYVEGLKKRSKK